MDDAETPATVPSVSQAVKLMVNTTTMRRANEGMKNLLRQEAVGGLAGVAGIEFLAGSPATRKYPIRVLCWITPRPLRSEPAVATPSGLQGTRLRTLDESSESRTLGREL